MLLNEFNMKCNKICKKMFSVLSHCSCSSLVMICVGIPGERVDKISALLFSSLPRWLQIPIGRSPEATWFRTGRSTPR